MAKSTKIRRSVLMNNALTLAVIEAADKKKVPSSGLIADVIERQVSRGLDTQALGDNAVYHATPHHMLVYYFVPETVVNQVEGLAVEHGESRLSVMRALLAQELMKDAVKEATFTPDEAEDDESDGDDGELDEEDAGDLEAEAKSDDETLADVTDEDGDEDAEDAEDDEDDEDVDLDEVEDALQAEGLVVEN